jgi:hypothetical protein
LAYYSKRLYAVENSPLPGLFLQRLDEVDGGLALLLDGVRPVGYDNKSERTEPGRPALIEIALLT